ncbi:MAG: AtpZ/AtpI family protein [Patescibacteria group bacterium]
MPDKKIESWPEIIGWAWGLGYRIALPLVFFALAGRALDKKIDTAPLFLLAGLAIALVSSAMLVYRMIRDISD